MKAVKKFFPQIFGGIASGILVSIGGTVLLSLENRVVGAVMFTVALLLICLMDFYLYTGKIGFAAESFDKSTAAQLAVGLLGNFIGATLTGLLMSYAKPDIVEKAKTSCQARLDNGILRGFVLGCMCGVLMYAAVKVYRAKGSIAGIIFCIPVFILCGFEHSIADMFYFSVAGMITPEYFGFIISVILGNTVGALALAALWILKGKQ